MNYSQTLKWLYSKLPMYHRIGAAAYKADLNNITALCKLLNNPEKKFLSIHIAGTNGKGSVSNFLASVFQEAGYKTGLFTSPHLFDFRERIRINGQMISKRVISSFVEKNKHTFSQIQPSFFEWTTALAFDYFARNNVDIAIIETGMGGRLDSTNVINPILSIITNISFDHAQFLGDTLEKIAYEKAGIIKNNIPVIIGEKQRQTKKVFTEKARQLDAPIFFAEDFYRADNFKTTPNFDDLIITYSKADGKKMVVHSALTGNYQLKNIATVLTALEILKNHNWKISHRAIFNGLKNVRINTGFRGRWDIISHKPLTICDIAHNEAGLKTVLEQIAKLNINKKHFVLGFVDDKEVDTILQLFPRDANYYFCRASVPRAMDAKLLFEKARVAGLVGKTYNRVISAYKAAMKAASDNDLIYIGGSTFVVADLKKCYTGN